MKRETVLSWYDGRCGYCGHKPPALHELTIDHIKPKVKGGTSCGENLMPACGPCNHMKGADSVEIFRKNIYSLTKRKHVKIAIRYGIVAPVKMPFKFYFEQNERINERPEVSKIQLQASSELEKENGMGLGEEQNGEASTA